MSQSEENRFEQHWCGVFRDAAETPPARVWDAIERELDEREAVVVPFWTRVRPLAFGAAASVMVVLLGWWAFLRPQPMASGGRVARLPTSPPAAQTTRAVVAPGRATPPASVASARLGHARRNAGSLPPARTLPANQPADGAAAAPQAVAAVAFQPAERTVVYRASRRTAGKKAGTENVHDEAAFGAVSWAGPHRAVSYAPLTARPLSLRSRQGISRVVWFRMPDEAAGPDVARRPREPEYWTAVTVMPMAFNPDASVRVASVVPVYGATSPGMNLNPSDPVQPLVQNQPRLSVAIQLNTGRKISDRWSVETGLVYLQGNATARSNALVVATPASSAANLLETTLRNSSQDQVTFYEPGRSNTLFAASAGSRNAVTNDFRYVQVPVQAGYHIRPRAKLSFAMLGGLLANVFVKNTVGSVEINPDDDVYRPLTVSGTGGLRVSYRPTRRWSGSLTGSYQYALHSGTPPDEPVQTRPRALGVGVGMNYHF